MARIGRIEKMTPSASGSASPGLTNVGTHLGERGAPSGRSSHPGLVAGGALGATRSLCSILSILPILSCSCRCRCRCRCGCGCRCRCSCSCRHPTNPVHPGHPVLQLPVDGSATDARRGGNHRRPSHYIRPDPVVGLTGSRRSRPSSCTCRTNFEGTIEFAGNWRAAMTFHATRR